MASRSDIQSRYPASCAAGPLLISVLCWLSLPLPGRAAPADGVYYTRQTIFLIPFQTEPTERRIQQVLLHASEDFGRTYQQVATAGPQDRNFRFQAQRDGWYWFTVQTQDVDGRLYPASLEGATPGLKVCVDTTPPQVTLRAASTRDWPVSVEWEIRDENPELLSLKLEYRATGRGGWQALTPQQMLLGRHGWNPSEGGALEVRLQLRDKAGNPAEAVTTLGPGAAPASTTTTGPGGQTAAPQGGNLIMVNKRRINLNFKLDNVGKSDVGTVEIWMTQDTRSWQKYGEAPRTPPCLLDLAGEGRYGFTLVAVSGVGLSEGRPRAGDPPQVWVEVDETRPEVRLVSVLVGQGIDQGKMTIKWVASDRFLTDTPITLSYSTSPEGPWTAISSNLGNDGLYVWQMPPDGLPYQMHVRVEAQDRAGNTGSDQTARPVAVDLSVPKATVIGIEAAPLR